MSFVIAVPDIMGAAAADLSSLGSTINGANAAAAVPTTALLPAAGDEVSAAIAALFGVSPVTTKVLARGQRRFMTGLCRP